MYAVIALFLFLFFYVHVLLKFSIDNEQVEDDYEYLKRFSKNQWIDECPLNAFLENDSNLE
jgi:hypothetical protein